MFNDKSILITGGTGSFGHTFVPLTLAKYNPRRLVIFSRDEMKQWEMAKLYGDDKRVRFFIGDVRDKDRLARALQGVDYVVHAAATKIVPTAEYNPFECVKTNINELSRFRRIKPAARPIFTVPPSWHRINFSSQATLMQRGITHASEWCAMVM
jgi:nucleoside-diphosphate-sugar epimerase